MLTTKLLFFVFTFLINQKKKTFRVPSERTEGNNIPDKGAASPEYALGFIDTLISAKFFYLKTAGLVTGINLLKMLEVPHSLFAHKNRVALSGIKDALHQMHTFHRSYAQW